jgi:hypothetical protein
MKIKISTEREINPQDFWSYIRELRRNNIPIDANELIRNGEWLWETDVGYTKATTVYKIEMDEAELKQGIIIIPEDRGRA